MRLPVGRSAQGSGVLAGPWPPPGSEIDQSLPCRDSKITGERIVLHGSQPKLLSGGYMELKTI